MIDIRIVDVFEFTASVTNKRYAELQQMLTEIIKDPVLNDGTALQETRY